MINKQQLAGEQTSLSSMESVALPLLTPTEYNQIVVEWNATARDYPYERSLAQCIEAQVERTPDAPAVVFEEQQLTYQELNKRANQLAHHLQSLGVGPDVVVSVSMERSLEMVIALVGILKAGGAYVPLDPTLPPERLAFMLEDLKAGTNRQTSVLLTLTSVVAHLPVYDAHVICLDTDWEQIASNACENPVCTTTPDHLAYVIYTSGSTGNPKGAMNTQRGICNRLLWMQEAYQLTAADSVFQKTPFSFDVSVWEFFWPLMTGARLVVAQPGGHKDSAYLISLMQQQNITTLHFVPSMLQIFLEEPGLEACTNLRQVICSGEALPYALQERFFARHPTAALYNLYGPTEAAIDVTHWHCQRQSLQRNVPIGYPIANTQLYILNHYGQPVPIGVTGELYIGGVGVARGYLNRPELTAERFVHDPFTTRPGARLYRTGDLARYLPDGAIEYLGRSDHQIKLRGFRVELGEIETVLSQHPAVREAVVTIHTHVTGDQRLTAYVVLQRRQEIPFSVLQEHLSRQVPDYMVPAAFVRMEALPLNSSGKVDRRALPPPADERPELPESFVAPRTSAEEIIVATWTECLGVKQVGIHDNFFALGGHSLLAMQVTSHLRKIFQVDLSLRDFFDAPTVAQFAQLVMQRTTGKPARALPAMRILARESQQLSSPPLAMPTEAVVLPMSFAQQRLWFLDQMSPQNAAYNISTTIHRNTTLDLEALQRSLQMIVQRHEVLRTTFALVDGQPRQILTPARNPSLAMVNLEHMPAIERQARAQHLLSEEAARPFDLVRGPLFRLTLLRLDEREHILILMMHHSISDGWSVNLFFQELITLYEALSTGHASPLLDLPVQYADFAEWQHALVQGELLAEQLAYWKHQLAGAPEVLELPADRPRPAIRTPRGATYSFTVSRALTMALKAFSQQEGITLYITLVAAFQALLYRYTGQDDLVIGTAIADRELTEVQGLLGLFLNTLALRTNFADNPTVRTLLQRVRDVILDAHANRDVPFELLVKELHLERAPGQSPLFQVSLTLDPPSPLSSSDWTLTRMATGTGASKFDLSLELAEWQEELAGHLEYSTDLFEEMTIARLAEHWQILLAGMVADATRPVGELPLLTEREREQMLFVWNNTRASYPKERCLHQLFTEQAARTPDAIAATFEETSLTYQALNARANQFAHYLQTLGVGPDVLVAICVERSLEMLVGLLGILKAGGAYVPLDPAYPAERVAFMLTDTGVSILVAQQSLVAQLPSHPARVICLDADAERFSALSQANPVTQLTSEHLCYVIYTSGSTGRPKGVQIPHRAVVNFLLSMQREPGLTTRDTLLAVSTLSFDIAGLELYLPLLTGAHLVIVSQDVATNGTALAARLERSNVTMMQATPITWRILLASRWPGKRNLKALCGAEALPVELARQLLPRVGSLYNMYGPTETTVWSTLCKIEATDSAISIGCPIANTSIAILDQHFQPVPLGVSGELYIGGDGLARGYLNRPELTRERFLLLSRSGNVQERFYRTGDLARYRSNGSIELIGRADYQVKLRGFRIELGEIEAVLEQHPTVQQAVALVRGDTPDDRRLVAYILPREQQTITADILRQHVSVHLPNYMIPSALVVLEKFPQTPNGKVDRRSLPAPALERPGVGGTCIAPRSALEEVIASSWSRALAIEQVGVHDNFFALGGHSLLALQVTSELRTTLQLELSLRNFFEAPTVAQLAELATRLKVHGADFSQPALRPQSRAKQVQTGMALPASFGQQGLWFLQQLDPQNSAYNIFVNIRLRRLLDVAALEGSLNALVERHEALRTIFAMSEGQLLQVIAPDLNIALSCQDLRPLAVSQRETEALCLANEEFQRPFDLTLGPLVRVSVLHLDERDHLLLLTMHHSISDGWSLGLLVQELVTLYEAYSTDQPSPLAALPLQFGDFAVWQQEWVQGPMLAEHLAYWKNSLAGAPTMLELPVDRPRLAELARRGAQHTFKLSRELTTALKALSVQEHVTLYMTLVGAFQALLQRYTGQNDLLLGTTSAGRTRTETAQMVGYFTNTLVLRADLAGDPSIRDLLRRVREATLNTQAHQEVPFDILVREFQPDRASGQSPLFQVFLTMDTPLPLLSQDWDVTQLDLETGAAKFDISLDLSERLGSLVGHLEYNADLFNASTIEHMAEHWELLLQAMVHDPAQRLNSIPLLTERERERILFEWNSTRTSYPREQSITRIFTEQVEHAPDACAAICEESAQTYRELNARANQLAHYLRRGGFQPGARAGIFIERSLDMLAGLLGILKAGGVYVPLDPTYPQERLAFMLEDAQVAALVTRQHLAERLPQHTTSTICLDRDWPAIALESQENPADFVSGEDSAYMIYTSGSTGRPKGVLGTHRASLNRFNWMWRMYPFTAGEVCCQKTSLSFVDAVWEIFGPLLQGVPLVIIPDPVVKDPAHFLQTLARHRVTRIVLVPSLLHALLESGGDLRQQLPDLKYWVSSGEALPLELAQRFQQHASQGSRLINLYGSSEVAADASYYEIKAGPGQLLSSVPIGKPIDNTQIYLLDQAMQLVPIGVTGELYIGGDGLARGYFNRPELTLARFVPNPFSRKPGARLYRTGDRARYLPDGNLEYLGRFDHQVKLRGMRIELGEIETALSQHPAVSEAVVALREDRPGDQRLIAYVVRQSGEETATSDLQRYLSLQLPGYMVPGVFVLLDALPLTPNGKVNRRALPTPDYQDSTRETTYVAPQLTIHYQLVQIWEELLTVRPIGIRDDFFALGGHSLLAARLMARIAEVCGKVLPLSLLFKNATIEGLAQALQEESQVQTRTLITPVQASGTQRPFFFLHGDWNGKAFYCLKVSRELGEQRPFYLLEPYRYEGLEALPSLEQVAAAHIEAMRGVQPNGPYLLGGWCNGAMVAYEMAHQLQAARQEVSLLVLMDPGTSSPFSNLLRRVIRGSSYLIKQKQARPDMLFLRLLHIYEYLRLWNYRKRLAAQANIERPPEEEESAHPNFASLFPPAENLRDNYMAIFNWLASGYQVRPYQGNIAVFWAEEDSRGRRKIWERLLAEQQEVKICFIPGTHMTSRTRHVHVLGKHLRACLDEAESRVIFLARI